MDKKHFTTKDVLHKVGISRNTLFLWFKQQKISEVKRDRNGHRIFTHKDINNILHFKNHFMTPSIKHA